LNQRKIMAFILGLAVSWAVGGVRAEDPAPGRLRQAIDAGRVCWRLSEPGEVIDLLGRPESESTQKDGGMLVRLLKYGDLEVAFARRRDGSQPYTLVAVRSGDRDWDIGQGRRLVLRGEQDLAKIDPFEGLAGVSLVRLDLRDRADFLEGMNYDTQTEWPGGDKMPAGLDPAKVLETARNPGLGIRALHERGIDGSGVAVAIIDQPLLLAHTEYTSRILRYDASGLDGFDPAFHASAVASILVGRTIGVAPGASLSFWAVPMWGNDNRSYIRALDRILELNAALPAGERIRAVSLSDGSFAGRDHPGEWREAVKRAEEAGLLVVTCDPSASAYGILACRPGSDPDDPGSYVPSRYSGPKDLVRVPGAGRTLASYRGPEVYFLDRAGGMSWGPPYIVGLAALAFQVNPAATPEEVRRALVATAQSTPAGPMVDPAAFIEAIKSE
jgi:hypothetical protein